MSARRMLAAALLLVAAGAGGKEAAPAEDAWNRLFGDWRGAGQVRGMAAEVELDFRPAAAGRARALSFRNRMRDAEGGEWVFEAEALYLCDAQGACRGHWYDSRGVVLPLSAAVEADRLVVHWGDEATERGRTTYRLQGDLLEVTDEVLGADGSWRTFGRTQARRR